MSWRSSLTGVAVGAVTIAMAGAAPASARSAPAPSPTASTHSVVSAAEQDAARSLAVALADRDLRARLAGAVSSTSDVDLRALAGQATGHAAGKALVAALATANRQIASAKGLDAAAGSLLRVRLGADSMHGALQAGVAPLVIAATADDHATTVTAYDSRGHAQQIAAGAVPNRPVYVVDIDGTKAVAAGLGVLNDTLAQHGLATPRSARADTAAGWWATKIDSVWLSDDEEPWFKGDAEIYSLVTGFGLDGKVRVDSVDMPYLNDDHVTYYPNQILVNWSNYKYNLADVVMMEDDGDTNYQQLAQAIATALLTITDQGTYIPLVTAVLNAIPTSWWTDDPDYVDSWYTLAQGSSGRLNGAAGNGWMTVEPYFVQQF